jgi:ABC-type glutathione transport system ATPase component
MNTELHSMTKPNAAATAPAADPAAYVRIAHVTKKFDDFVAVDNVSLDIRRGEIFCLLGGSGSGKTTLLRVLAGFETPTSGALYIDGADMSTIPPYERPVNMMFQSAVPLSVEKRSVRTRAGGPERPTSAPVRRYRDREDGGFGARKRTSSPAASASASAWHARW